MRILLVEPSVKICSEITALLEKFNWNVSPCAGAREAVKILNRDNHHLGIISVDAPPRNGLPIWRDITGIQPDLPLMMLAERAAVPLVLNALEDGALDYVIKPIVAESFLARLEGVLFRIDKKAIRQDAACFSDGQFIGQSPKIQRIRRLIPQIAKSSSAVLILGESGTGKEVLAQEIHRLSPRAARPFVAVNCAALPEGVVESELFGHMKGAYTDAVCDKPGLFEIAHGGTLFLDEIGELSAATQCKLLRFLQDHVVMRVGGLKTYPVDVRVITATNCALTDEVKRGRFREDLYYRIHVCSFVLPPLRERMEDLCMLVSHFIKKYHTANKALPTISGEALLACHHYGWPGNIRELENAIQYALVFANGDGQIRLEHLPQPIRQQHIALSEKLSPDPFDASHVSDRLARIECLMIRQALEQHHGNQSLAAVSLGIKRTTLQYKMKKYGLHK